MLKPGGHFVCSFVGGADDTGRMRKLRKLFDGAPGFGGAESDLRTSLTGSGDRLWAVWATKAPENDTAALARGPWKLNDLPQ